MRDNIPPIHLPHLSKFIAEIKARSALNEAIRAEGTPRIQEAWDRLEQWVDSPPMLGEGESQ